MIPPVYLVAYNIISILSALVISATLLTAICSSRLHRGKGWLGMMSCWLVYAISYTLLIGNQIGPEPTFGRCFAQTILVYSAPPLASAGMVCFYLDFYLGASWDSTHHRALKPWIGNLMLVFPWIVHLGIDIEVIILTLHTGTETAIVRAEPGLYCHLRYNFLPDTINAGIVILSAVILVPLEVWTGIQLYRSRANYTDTNFQKYLAVYLRMAACTLGALSAFGLGVIVLANAKGGTILIDLSYPCLSMVVSIIFVSQQDFLNVWLCRRRVLLSSSSRNEV